MSESKYTLTLTAPNGDKVEVAGYAPRSCCADHTLDASMLKLMTRMLKRQSGQSDAHGLAMLAGMIISEYEPADDAEWFETVKSEIASFREERAKKEER